MRIEKGFLDFVPAQIDSFGGNFEETLSTAESRAVNRQESDRSNAHRSRQRGVDNHRTNPQPSSTITQDRDQKSENINLSNLTNEDNYETDYGLVEETDIFELQNYPDHHIVEENIINDLKRENYIEQELINEYSTLEKEEDYYNAVMYTFANVLDIPIETIEEILQEEGILVEDLKEPSYQHKIVQNVYDVETPAQLLDIPEIAEVFTQLNKAMLEIEQEEPQLNLKLENFENEEIETTSTITEQEMFQSENNNENGDFVNHNINQVESSQVNEDNDTNVNQNIVLETGQNHVARPAVSQTVTNTPISPPQIMEQIKGQIKLSLSGAVSEMKFVLTPDSLGEINLRLIAQNGIITAQFTAQNQKIKEIIESNFNELKEEMESKGIQIGELSVSVRQENHSQMDNFLKEQEKSQQRISNIIQNIMEEPEEQEQEIKVEGSTVSYTA